MTKKFELQGPDGKTYEIEAPDEGAAFDAFRRMMGVTSPEKNEALNTLRIAGTGAVQGATDVANIPSTVTSLLGETGLGLAKMERELGANKSTAPVHGFGLAGPSMMGAFLKPQRIASSSDKDIQATRGKIGAVSKALDVRPFVENSIGLPTDPEQEAKRLGAEMTPLRKALASGTRFGTSALAMGAGLPMSAATAVGAGVGETVGGETGALVGSMLSPVAAGRMVAKSSLKAAEKASPTVAGKKAEAQAIYKGSGADEAIIGAPALESGVDRIKKLLAKEAFHPKGHPQTAIGLNILEDAVAKGNMTLKGSEKIRDIVRDQGRGITVNPDDKRLVRAMVAEWDDATRGMKNKDAVQGDVEKAVADYKKADKIWGQAKRGEEIQKVIDTAKTRAASPDLALRNEFGTLVRQLEKKGWPGYSEADKAAVKAMAEPNLVRKLVRGVGYAPIVAPLYRNTTNAMAEQMATKQADRLRNLLLRDGPAEMSPTAASTLARALLNSPAAALVSGTQD